MERDVQAIPEEDGGVCADGSGCADDAGAVVQEGGHDPLPGGGEREPDSEVVCEELDLMMLPPRLRARFERESEEERRLTREQRDELNAMLPPGRVRFDEQMSLHSSASVGGVAEAFITVESTTELKNTISWAVERDVEYRLWGRGSAQVIRDKGARGLFISLGEGFGGMSIDRVDGDDVFVMCGASAKLYDLAGFIGNEKLVGLDAVAAARGTLGGFISSSAAASDEEPMAALEELSVMTKDGRELTLKRAALRVEEGHIKLPRTTAIVRALLKMTREAQIAEAKAASSEIPLDRPALCGVFASGCRTTASELIEDAGLIGVRVGGARVAGEDANSILNQGKATARDFAVLMNLMRDRVREQTGITMVPRVEFIGER